MLFVQPAQNHPHNAENVVRAAALKGLILQATPPLSRLAVVFLKRFRFIAHPYVHVSCAVCFAETVKPQCDNIWSCCSFRLNYFIQVVTLLQTTVSAIQAYVSRNNLPHKKGRLRLRYGVLRNVACSYSNLANSL